MSGDGDAAFVNSVIPVWVPLVFLEPVFLWSFAFYVVTGLGFRALVLRVWPPRILKDGEPKTPADILDFKKRDSVGRWSPSLIHASIASVICTLAGFSLVSESVISNQDVIMHSLGYFMGDLVVDRDPGYVVHHVGPVIHAEVMLRLGAHFWHTMRAGWIMEYGNVVAHSAAVLTFRTGKTFHLINTWSFWISRPLSYYDGFMAWYSDVPSHVRFTWLGLIPLISIIGVYHSNTMWMIKMCKKRPPKPTPEVTKQPEDTANDTETDTSASTKMVYEGDGMVLEPTGKTKSAAPMPEAAPASAASPRVGSRKGRPQRDKDA